MADHIEGPISRIETKIENGKLKHKKIKLKSDVAKKVDKEVARIMNDNISSGERDKICKEATQKAKSPVAKVKRKISKEIGRDLGLEMS